MQNIGNTYQTIKNNVASNGNISSAVSKNNAADFSDLLSSISKNSSLSALGNTKNSVRSDKKVNTVSSSDRRSENLSKSSKAPERDVKTVKEKPDSVEKDRSDSAPDADVKSAGVKPEDKEMALTDSTEIIMNSTDLFSDADCLKSDVISLNQKIELVDKIVQRSSDFIKSDAAQSEALKSSLLNLSNEELTALENSDDATLNEFVNKAVSSAFQTDPDVAKDFLKAGVLKDADIAKGSLNSSFQSDPVKSSSDDEPLDSWFNDLLGDAQVEDVKITAGKSESSDFGAEDFDLIEKSLKLTRTLDESLAKADVKSKIDAIMDSKADAHENTLQKSLELLKGMAQGKTGTSANAPEITSYRSDLNATSEQKIGTNGFLSLEQAIKSAVEGSVSSMSSDLSQDSGFQGNQNQSFQSMLQQSAATNKENTQILISKQFDLLSMSSSLKQNAQALTEKVMQMASKNLKTMDLTLNPEGLGRMKISLYVGGADDVTRISISASSPATRALVEQGMDVLRQTLRDNDISAQAEVTEYEDNSSNQNGNSQQETADRNGHSQNGHEEQSHDDLNYGTFFASDEHKNNVSENDTENLINSQNGDSVSYFA